ncbi:hypothetical protein J3E68DRAFT_225214 [Trichoderma sp. SZMC 28012]
MHARLFGFLLLFAFFFFSRWLGGKCLLERAWNGCINWRRRGSVTGGWRLEVRGSPSICMKRTSFGALMWKTMARLGICKHVCFIWSMLDEN